MPVIPQTHGPAANHGTQNNNPAGIGFWALVSEDFRTHESDPLSQGFWALFWHRYGNWRMSVQPRPLRMPLSLFYKVAARVTQWFCGIDLPYTVRVGRRVKLEHFGGMILVAHTVGDDVIIRQNTTFGLACPSRPNARPIIGDRVDIGAGAVILGGITIGHDTVIGANAVVNKDQPAHVVVGGVPARILRHNTTE